MGGGGGGGVMNWEIGIYMYTPMCIKWMTNKNLPYKKINKIKFFKNPQKTKKKTKDNCHVNTTLKTHQQGFPGGAVVENPPANAGDTGSSPGLGRSHMPRSD